MRATLTNFSLSFSRVELNFTIHPQSKSRRVGAIFLMLIMIRISPVVAQLPANMVAGSYTLTTSTLVPNWFDPGGSGGGFPCPSVNAGNYSDNLNVTETVTANVGQKIVVT